MVGAGLLYFSMRVDAVLSQFDFSFIGIARVINFIISGSSLALKGLNLLG